MIESFALRRICACSQLQELLVLIVYAMASVIDNKQVVWSVVLGSEVADSTVELQLCFALYIQFDYFGVVVEAVTEQGLEFYCLASR